MSSSTLPKISIATVTWNCVGCLEESILSVVNQTYDNVEYIVIDGGSTDGTLELLKRYEDKIAVLVSEPDQGIYDAMNKALRLATGDFILFLGSDDHLLSWRTLEKVAPKLTDQDHIFYGQVYLEILNIIHKGEYSRWKRARFNYNQQCIFYPKSIYKQFSFDLKYKIASDDDYNFRASTIAPFKYIGDVISFYACGGASGVLNNDKEWEKVRPRMIKKYCGYLPWLYRRAMEWVHRFR